MKRKDLVVVENRKELLIKKHADYSSDNLIKVGKLGVASRLVDKVHRLHNLSRSSKSANFETVEDTLMDIKNYVDLYKSVDTLEPSIQSVYLAGPIDAIDPLEASCWRVKVATELAKNGILSFNPFTPYQFGSNPTQTQKEQIIQINLEAIRQCDVVFVYLPVQNVPAFGTIREIEYARSLGKDVIVYTHERIKSFMMTDCLNVSSLQEFYTILKLEEK